MCATTTFNVQFPLPNVCHVFLLFSQIMVKLFLRKYSSITVSISALLFARKLFLEQLVGSVGSYIGLYRHVRLRVITQVRLTS